MKQIKLVMGLLLAILFIHGCCPNDDDERDDVWKYQPVMFNFHDASSKDLVKEIVESLIVEYETENVILYKGKAFYVSENYYNSFSISYPESCMDPVKAFLDGYARVHEMHLPVVDLSYGKGFSLGQSDISEICFEPKTSNQCSKAKMMTLHFKSPIFGDDREHEIVLYFDDLKVSRILVDDKECSFAQQTIDDFRIRNTSTHMKVVVAYAAVSL